MDFEVLLFLLSFGFCFWVFFFFCQGLSFPHAGFVVTAGPLAGVAVVRVERDHTLPRLGPSASLFWKR